MCGIIGYIGERKASEVLLKGLKTLEYRGYDSVGMAVDNETTIEIKKDKGMVEEVNQRLDFTSLEGKKGIGHTRWATHGRPTKENAHPHSDCTGNIAIVHNGVLENYQSLRKELISKGHKLKSETDSELIAHILEDEIKENEHKQAFLNTINKLKGSFAIVSIIKNDN
ncbi:class II glutamine amidotransferase, partial [Candidatus Micrarchaeota archaeon]|nr:class II glutamine amidotransferase [Candidatus Micrarchaeota archaeon]